MRGVKMGECRLKINVARFAVENSSAQAPIPGLNRGNGMQGQPHFLGTGNLRNSRSYSFVAGSSKVQGGVVKEGPNAPADWKQLFEKSVIVPERSVAFSELVGVALVGRTMDLETLVDFDKLLRIAKVVVANVQYLGGLTMLITFHDKPSAVKFLEAKELWGPWFSKLEGWKGQSLPLERVAWLKLCGLPLHLFSSEVMAQVGELFGKVLHVPKGVEEDQDLSVCRVGVLLGEAIRVIEGVSISWKDKLFRIWVEEDPEDWTPDWFGVAGSPELVEGSPMVSSPVININRFETWGNEESLHGDCGEGAIKSVGDGVSPHARGSPGLLDRDDVGVVEEVRSDPVQVDNSDTRPKVVGPVEAWNFLSGSGEGKKKPSWRRRSGSVSKKAQSSSFHGKEELSGDARPKKRPRESASVRKGRSRRVRWT
ncbi:hypothetical protein Hdeb2414_s0027g00689341 [Helianthus debilis subsp. tardiflorus]